MQSSLSEFEYLWAEADRTGRIECRIDCPHCCKRHGDKTLSLNTQKGAGVCHRCDFRIVRGKSSGHFSEKYITALDTERPVFTKPDTRSTEARAQRAVSLSTPAPDNHAYLVKKRIQPHGVGLLGCLYSDLPSPVRHKGNVLVIPLQNVNGKVLSIQFISGDGSKAYMAGSKRPGGFYFIEGNDRLWICEGFATAASLHEDTGDSVACAFDTGGLLPVTGALTAMYPRRDIVILADDDWHTDNNPGLTKAQAAAQAHGVKVLQPDFTGFNRGPKDTDFNDLVRLRNEL